MNRLLAVNIGIDTPLGSNTLQGSYPTLASVFSIILNNSFTVIGIILLVLLISGGLMFIIGAGNDDPKKTQQGQKTLTSALVGFAIVFLAYFIIQIIEVLTGLKILENTI